MERLTFLNGDEIPCVRNDQCFEEQSEHYCGPAIDRLAAYEDTRLMPEEVLPKDKAVSLHDIYRVIAGHSYYHGDRILAALTCITEGKEVNPVRPAYVAPVVHGRWIEKSAPARKIYFECSHCGAQENKHTAIKGYYCWRCGAKMDGGDIDEAD